MTKQENRIELKFCVGCPQKVSLLQQRLQYQIFVLTLKFDKDKRKKKNKIEQKFGKNNERPKKQSNMKRHIPLIVFDTL